MTLLQAKLKIALVLYLLEDVEKKTTAIKMREKQINQMS